MPRNSPTRYINIMDMHTYIYIYIYIYGERERERAELLAIIGLYWERGQHFSDFSSD
jgi:hypothetical protein